MNKRLLLDTNILIYSIDADSIFHKESQDLILNQNFELYTTSKNIAEFLVVITKSENIKINVVEALEILKDLLTFIKILYPTEESTKKFEELLKKYLPSGLRIHDFDIVSIGLSYGINQITTKNIRDFKDIKEIEIINP